MGYEPGEAAVKLKGGNSNWRGPVWFPTSYLLIHSFLRFDRCARRDLAVHDSRQQRPVRSHRTTMAEEAANRMISIFKRGR